MADSENKSTDETNDGEPFYDATEQQEPEQQEPEQQETEQQEPEQQDRVSTSSISSDENPTDDAVFLSTSTKYVTEKELEDVKKLIAETKTAEDSARDKVTNDFSKVLKVLEAQINEIQSNIDSTIEISKPNPSTLGSILSSTVPATKQDVNAAVRSKVLSEFSKYTKDLNDKYEKHLMDKSINEKQLEQLNKELTEWYALFDLREDGGPNTIKYRLDALESKTKKLETEIQNENAILNELKEKFDFFLTDDFKNDLKKELQPGIFDTIKTVAAGGIGVLGAQAIAGGAQSARNAIFNGSRDLAYGALGLETDTMRRKKIQAEIETLKTQQLEEQLAQESRNLQRLQGDFNNSVQLNTVPSVVTNFANEGPSTVPITTTPIPASTVTTALSPFVIPSNKNYSTEVNSETNSSNISEPVFFGIKGDSRQNDSDTE